MKAPPRIALALKHHPDLLRQVARKREVAEKPAGSARKSRKRRVAPTTREVEILDAYRNTGTISKAARLLGISR